jgi:hypothetical protein
MTWIYQPNGPCTYKSLPIRQMVLLLVKSGSISKITLLFIQFVSDQTVAVQTAALISLRSNVALLPNILWKELFNTSFSRSHQWPTSTQILLTAKNYKTFQEMLLWNVTSRSLV